MAERSVKVWRKPFNYWQGRPTSLRRQCRPPDPPPSHILRSRGTPEALEILPTRRILWIQLPQRNPYNSWYWHPADGCTIYPAGRPIETSIPGALR
jgi:hypothetical protein